MGKPPRFRRCLYSAFWMSGARSRMCGHPLQDFSCVTIPKRSVTCVGSARRSVSCSARCRLAARLRLQVSPQSPQRELHLLQSSTDGATTRLGRRAPCPATFASSRRAKDPPPRCAPRSAYATMSVRCTSSYGPSRKSSAPSSRAKSLRRFSQSRRIRSPRTARLSYPVTRWPTPQETSPLWSAVSGERWTARSAAPADRERGAREARGVRRSERSRDAPGLRSRRRSA